MQCPVTKIGPWGSSHEGTVQDITESPKRLESITLYHGWSVDSISFTYLDHAGEKHKAGPWGGPGGDPIMVSELPLQILFNQQENSIIYIFGCKILTIVVLFLCM
jgi:hypothetical protein